MRFRERVLGTKTDLYPDVTLHFEQRRYAWDERNQAFPFTQAREYWHNQSNAIWEKIESNPQGVDMFIGRLTGLSPADQYRTIELLGLSTKQEKRAARLENLGTICAGLLEYYFSGEREGQEDQPSFQEKRQTFFHAKYEFAGNLPLGPILRTLSQRALVNDQILVGLQKYGKILASQLNRLDANGFSAVLAETSEEIKEILDSHGLRAVSFTSDPYVPRREKKDTVEKPARPPEEFAEAFLRMDRKDKLKALGLILQSLSKRKKEAPKEQ